MKIAVIGLGFMGRTHSAALRALPALRTPAVQPELHTLVSRRPADVAEEARAIGFSHVTSDLSEALEQVDVVDICTPNSLHREAVELAVAAGKPIYLEKPLAANLADAEAIAGLGAGVVNQVAVINRYAPAAIRMKMLMQAGTIGELLQFRVTFNHSGYLNPHVAKGWRSTSELSGGGGLLDLGIHALDLLIFLIGQVTLKHHDLRTIVKARALVPGGEFQPVKVDDWALLQLEAAGGAPGILETSRIALGAECFQIELYGTNGSIVCDLNKDAAPRVQAFGPAPAPAEAGALQYLPPVRLSLGKFMDCHQASLYHFLLRAAGQDPTPGWAATFDQVLLAERLIHQAIAG